MTSSPESLSEAVESAPESPVPESSVPESSVPESPVKEMSVGDWQAQFRSRALYCLKETLDPYQDGQQLALQPELQPLIGQLKTLHQKIVQGALQIAVFGYVSRGKSALLNALLGEPILATGALNGVTQWPRSIQWQPFVDQTHPWKIELVDTPGLGEVDGGNRAQMALKIAQASDLLLFVVAGQPNEVELESLRQLQVTDKPLLLIANKADLNPNLTADEIWTGLNDQLKHWIQPTDILMTAANPAAKKVRHEWPDGRVTEEWEVPPPQVAQVRDRLKQFLTGEAFISLIRNVLEQAEQTQGAIAASALKTRSGESVTVWQRYGSVKAIAIAVLPFWWLDAPVNLLMDLLFVRSLVNLYELPTTRHHVEDLWRTIFFSLFGVLLCDLASGVSLTIGNAVGDGLANLGGVILWGSTAVLQFFAATYGTQKVREATTQYLSEGVTWAPQGASQLLAELKTYSSNTGIDR